jgi:hypothetical protein
VEWKHWIVVQRLQGTKCCTRGLMGKEIALAVTIMPVNPF